MGINRVLFLCPPILSVWIPIFVDVHPFIYYLICEFIPPLTHSVPVHHSAILLGSCTPNLSSFPSFMSQALSFSFYLPNLTLSLSLSLSPLMSSIRLYSSPSLSLCVSLSFLLPRSFSIMPMLVSISKCWIACPHSISNVLWPSLMKISVLEGCQKGTEFVTL